MITCKAALSTQSDAREAAAEVCSAVSGLTPDLAMIFCSHHFGPEFTEILQSVVERLDARNLIGCTGESIIGPDCEVEGEPAVSLWAASMPGVRVLPFLIDQEDLQQMTSSQDWYDRLGTTPDDRPSFVVLPDPFSLSFEHCRMGMDAAFPGSVVVGGMASGATGPNQNRLFLNDQILRQGMVGVSLSGPIVITPVVSQGCRPVGKSFVITKANSNVIEELGGHSAFSVLQKVYEEADAHDKELMRQGLHIGRVIDERLEEPRPGDFLIRNLAGVVENRALVVGDFFRPGQTIRFHVRDESIADEEMRWLMRNNLSGHKPNGGLLFSCNGRGTRMFSRPNHDIGVVNEYAQGCQVAGFFAQGEIGPVGGRTFVHGFTSSLVLFRDV